MQRRAFLKNLVSPLALIGAMAGVGNAEGVGPLGDEAHEVQQSRYFHRTDGQNRARDFMLERTPYGLDGEGILHVRMIHWVDAIQPADLSRRYMGFTGTQISFNENGILKFNQSIPDDPTAPNRDFLLMNDDQEINICLSTDWIRQP